MVILIVSQSHELLAHSYTLLLIKLQEKVRPIYSVDTYNTFNIQSQTYAVVS